MGLFTAFPINGDTRVENWPLMKDVFPTIIICIIYVCAIIFGPKWMKDKNPFELRHFMFIYNLFQVIICGYITYEGIYIWIKDRYRFVCQPVDYSNRMTAIQACYVFWLYYIMKIVDLIDTIMFILRKKNNQITFLHIYHHLTMPVFAWYGTKYVGGGQSTFVPLLNSFIHVIMYTYYGLSACGPRIQKYLWWKRYITQAQIIQFTVAITHSSINLLTPCNYPKVFDVVSLLYGILVLALFTNFYLQSYLKKPKHQKE